MFTPGWEEAIKEPVMVTTMVAEAERPGETQRPNAEVPALVPAERKEPMMPAAQHRGPARKRHAPAAKKAAGKSTAKKATSKKSTSKKATTKKKTAARSKKSTTKKSSSKSSSRKTARKSR
jgi:ribonuclease E